MQGQQMDHLDWFGAAEHESEQEKHITPGDWMLSHPDSLCYGCSSDFIILVHNGPTQVDLSV